MFLLPIRITKSCFGETGIYLEQYVKTKEYKYNADTYCGAKHSHDSV